MDANKTPIVNAGIDWLTTTATTANEAKLLLHEAEKIQSEEVERGFFIKPWRQSGYSGFCAGRIQHGERDDSAIARVSSELADLEWFRLWQITERATRIDVQVTLRPEGGPNPFIHKIRKRVKRHFAKHGRAPAMRTITSSDGGLTFYLGSRESAVFFRCYNKEVESGEEQFEGCVRCELELKGCAVGPTFAFLFANLPTSAFASRLLSSFMRERGCGFLNVTDNPPSFYEGQNAATDQDKLLGWLSAQVRPSVLKLIRSGKLQETLNALGLMDHVVQVPVIPDSRQQDSVH